MWIPLSPGWRVQCLIWTPGRLPWGEGLRGGAGLGGIRDGSAVAAGRRGEDRGQLSMGLRDTTWEHVDSEFCVFFLLVRKQAHPQSEEQGGDAETGRQVLPGAGGPETAPPALPSCGWGQTHRRGAGLRSSLALWSEWFCTPAPTPSCFLLPLLPPTPCPCPCPCPCLGAAGSLGAGTAGEKLAAEASSLREQRHREERRWREGLSPEARGPATARPAPHFLCPGPLLPKLV